MTLAIIALSLSTLLYGAAFYYEAGCAEPRWNMLTAEAALMALNAFALGCLLERVLP